jgi:hypothetical protein
MDAETQERLLQMPIFSGHVSRLWPWAHTPLNMENGLWYMRHGKFAELYRAGVLIVTGLSDNN